MPEALFVYGTLMPGHLRWPMLEAHSISQRTTTVPGVLFDTGQGWPAAVFDAELAAGTDVPGWVVTLKTRGVADLIRALDDMEGVSTPAAPGDVFRRIRVTVAGRDTAWAYHAAEVPPGWVRIDAWTDQPEA